MKTRVFLILSILLLALALAACDSGSAATGTPAAVPAAAGAAAVVTPGAQRTRPSSAETSAATPVPAATATAATASTAPTAVPVPVIIVPTPLPERTPAPKATTQASASPTTQPATVVVPSTPATAKEWTLEELRGKIIFFSDRGGGYPQLYLMDADGGNQQLCNCLGVLETVVDQEVTSPDGGQYLYVTTVGSGRGGGDTQIWVHRNATNENLPLTGGAPGFPGVDYDPTWSPDARYVAWVSQTNGADEIYLYDRLTNESPRLTQSSGEWYKHPTFSPDGSQIAYWTNVQNAERKQIWVMNRDGGGKHNLSQNTYNDWDPIWVK